ncbi:DUF421 domain-containing protein [Apibacter sp.]|uniref:DUF421 domain-containing protein n=1 Tax=Apibacter sp. TaxID=2023709 RepID=UPI0025F508C4|nr:YetF domain-containing protein [Apibacter sp.]MCT6868367.1 DUF421 domain-containing protein [Apibacter sp.]
MDLKNAFFGSFNLYDNIFISIKLVVAFFAVLVYIKLVGRTILNQVSGIDLIQNIVLGGLVGGIIYNPNISIMEFALVLFIWTFIVYLIAFLTKKYSRLRGLIEGPIIPLVLKGKFNIEGFRKAKIDIMTYASVLKNNGIYDISKVYFAQMEQDGSITAFTDDYDKYAVLLVIEGKINHVYLDGINKTEEWLKDELRKQGYDDVSEIFLAQWSPKKFFIVPKDQDYKLKVNE